MVVWGCVYGVALAARMGCAQEVSAGALGGQVEAVVAETAVSRAHWGVVVEGMDGAPIYSLNGGQFFQPASNTKLFTTAAAMALLGPEQRYVTRVLVGDLTAAANEGDVGKRGNLLLVGAGDANLAGREMPYVPPALRPKPVPGAAPAAGPDPLRDLATMADAVVASGVKDVPGDVIGDDTVWPSEPFAEAWEIDDMVWGYGAPVSALTVSDGQMHLTVTPGEAGKPAAVTLDQAVPYYTLEAAVMTMPAKAAGGDIEVERAPGSRVLRVYGKVAADAGADVEEIAIADPAEYAAMAFKAMLEARGVLVRGAARALHRQSSELVGFQKQAHEELPADPASRVEASRDEIGCVDDCDLRNHVGMKEVAQHISPTLEQDVTLTNKVSQNLHAELLLRQLGAKLGDAGTAAQGARVVRWFLTTKAGVDPEDFVFFDGSGLSGHDLVTPRATVRLLTWASGQPWFAAWRATLPVGGVDGSLVGRFGKGPLKGKVFAKTGTLGEARALSGYLQCASGRTVAFSVMVTDHTPIGRADQEAMDRIVLAIAAAD